MRLDRAGYTLLEVIVATMLIAFIVTSCFSLALISRQNRGRIDRRTAAALAGRSVSQALKGYVTADRSLARGPGDGPDGWQLPGDRCGCYALAPGRHELDASAWMADLAGAPYNGAISYDVTAAAARGGPQPTVQLNVAWNEP